MVWGGEGHSEHRVLATQSRAPGAARLADDGAFANFRTSRRSFRSAASCFERVTAAGAAVFTPRPRPRRGSGRKRPTANADPVRRSQVSSPSEKRFHRVHDRLGPGADQRTRDPRVDRHSHEMPKRNGIRHGHSFPKAPKNQLVPNPKGLTASKTNATRVPDQRLSATQAPQSCPRSPPRNENRSCRGCESCPRLR